MLGILLCFIGLRANLARGGNGGVAEKGSQLRGCQFQGTDSLNDLAVFFLLTLFLQVFDLGLPLGGLLPGLFQLLVDFFKFGHIVLLFGQKNRALSLTQRSDV